MTLNAKTEGCYGFFGDFGLQDTFQERITPKSIEIDMERLRTECSALNVDFDGPSLDFLGSRKPAHEGIKERYPLKVVIVPLLASLLWKRLQIGMDMLPITTSTSHELLSRINTYDFDRPWTCKIRGFYWFLRSSAAAHTLRMNCDKMSGDRLTVREQELL